MPPADAQGDAERLVGTCGTLDPCREYPGISLIGRTLVIQLEPTGDPQRWTLLVTPSLCAGTRDAPFLYGGSALAALIRAMTVSTGRPPIWSTAQYLDYIRPGEILNVTVTIEVEGKMVTQASATLSLAGKVVVSAMGAFGAKNAALTDAWPTRPDVPLPDQCPRVAHRGAYPDGIYSRVETRLASGRFPIAGERFGSRSADGRSRLWLRALGQTEVTPELLAIAGDYISAGGSHALGRACTANSLDNTMRFTPRRASGWILCDIGIDAVAAGFMHGTMRIFADSGDLLAMASTSLILRVPPIEARPKLPS
jgi:acyl-CoA thioesterase II